MADFTKFRTALNGFHRGDVAQYLETLCQEHQQALEQQQRRVAALEEELSQAKDELERQRGVSNILQMQLTDTETALHETEKALEEALSLPEEQSAQEEPAEEDYETKELEAYRRAEAMERGASERAARLRQRLTELTEHVSSRYQEAGQEIQVLTEDIRTNLKRLTDTMSDLDAIFDETTDSFAELEE